jgi:hypothetical protein
MRFELAIPDPATIRLGRQSYVTLKGCDSAWKKDPLRGVIGVQTGPL